MPSAGERSVWVDGELPVPAPLPPGGAEVCLPLGQRLPCYRNNPAVH